MLYTDDTHWSYWHCLLCGNVEDELIILNRMLSKPPAWIVAELMLAELFTGSTTP